MDHNYYKITDLYLKKIISEESGSYRGVNDTKNSYQTTASMMGPNNGPVQGTNGGIAQGGENVMFPDSRDLSKFQKVFLLVKFFKMEIDNDIWDEKTTQKFKDMLNYLIGLELSEEE
jgi:hypothetical protein